MLQLAALLTMLGIRLDSSDSEREKNTCKHIACDPIQLYSSADDSSDSDGCFLTGAPCQHSSASCESRTSCVDTRQERIIADGKRKRAYIPLRYSSLPSSGSSSSRSLESSTASVSRNGVPKRRRPRKVRVKRTDTSGRERNKQRTRALSWDACSDVCKFECRCAEHCSRNFSAQNIYEFRHDIWAEASYKEVIDFLCQLLHRDGIFCPVASAKPASFKFRYFVEQKEVCSPFFQQASGVCKTKMCEVRQRIASGRLFAVPYTNVARSGDSTRGAYLEAWMDSHFALHGQYIPNTGEMHLPIKEQKSDVFKEYSDHVKERNAKPGLELMKPITASPFYKLWLIKFPQVKCTRWIPFTKCAD